MYQKIIANTAFLGRENNYTPVINPIPKFKWFIGSNRITGLEFEPRSLNFLANKAGRVNKFRRLGVYFWISPDQKTSMFKIDRGVIKAKLILLTFIASIYFLTGWKIVEYRWSILGIGITVYLLIHAMRLALFVYLIRKFLK
ncbi:MAG: hypothetical protein HYZ14_09355 [Bacteroidetes bacterium]|nr:hypothetical protein [Bacteroidota bacterium]